MVPEVSIGRGGGSAVIDAFAEGARSRPNERGADGAGSVEPSGKIRAEFNAILPARALAIIMFRSGGYAACVAELQPCSPREPPTSDACVR
eukprot:1069713-Pleurochrysis_carterae.AAC.4